MTLPPTPSIVVALLTILSAILSGILMGDEKKRGGISAIPCIAAFCLGALALLSNTDMVYDEALKQGKKEASIACNISDCPYKLKTFEDSTRVWIKVNDD